MNHQFQQQFSGFPRPHQTMVSQVPHNEASTWKRPRDSPSPTSLDTDSSWNQSFKRLKVVDDGETVCSQPTSSSYAAVAPQNHYLPPNDRRLPPPSNTHYQQNHYQQTAGQRSSEDPSPAATQACSDYHNMNSLLGNLHLMRRRQRAGETVAPQQERPLITTQSIQHVKHHNSAPSSHCSSRKKVVQLRVDSKLY